MRSGWTRLGLVFFASVPRLALPYLSQHCRRTTFCVRCLLPWCRFRHFFFRKEESWAEIKEESWAEIRTPAGERRAGVQWQHVCAFPATVLTRCGCEKHRQQLSICRMISLSFDKIVPEGGSMFLCWTAEALIELWRGGEASPGVCTNTFLRAAARLLNHLAETKRRKKLQIFFIFCTLLPFTVV